MFLEIVANGGDDAGMALTDFARAFAIGRGHAGIL